MSLGRHAPLSRRGALASSPWLACRPRSPRHRARALRHLEATAHAPRLREIAEAEQLGSWRELQQRWQGQVVRWTVTRQRVLCRSADDCNVAAFPRQRPAKQGWMPLLSFAPGQYERLATDGLVGGAESARNGAARSCRLRHEA
jgi:hypothetical protein